jgi:hypothetical protein
VDLRNRVWGHGAGRDDHFYASILPTHRQRLEAELHRCQWLRTRALWVPQVVDDNARVTSADLLNGERRLQSREVMLQLDPGDLVLNGGDVVPKQTLLVVDEATGRYVPLFPLALSSPPHVGQGVFFLNDLDWATQAERLKKVRYFAYDPSLADYEVPAGELAVQRLEARVHQLAPSRIGTEEQRAALFEMAAKVPLSQDVLKKLCKASLPTEISPHDATQRLWSALDSILDPAERLWTVLDFLWNIMPQPNNRLPVCEFIERLACHTADPKVAHDLRVWSDDVLPRLHTGLKQADLDSMRADLAAEDMLTQAPPVHLLVKLIPARGNRQRRRQPLFFATIRLKARMS